MSEFLAALQAFPTVFYTGLLGVCLLYWITVIIGALDLDLFGGQGGADGHDVDAGGHGHGTSSLLEFFSLGRVPIPITVSAFALVGWGLGMLAELNLRPWLGTVLPGFLYPLVMGVALTLVAGFAAAMMVRPLRPIFTTKEEHGEQGLIGRQVKITSLKADHHFGTALCDNDGPGIIMRVVCRDGVELKRDEMAVVVEFDEAKQVYLIAPFSHVDTEGRATGAIAPVLPPPGDAPALSTPHPPVSLERQREHPH